MSMRVASGGGDLDGDSLSQQVEHRSILVKRQNNQRVHTRSVAPRPTASVPTLNDGVELPATPKRAHILAELVQPESDWQTWARGQEFANHLGDTDRLTWSTGGRLGCPTQPCLTSRTITRPHPRREDVLLLRA